MSASVTGEQQRAQAQAVLGQPDSVMEPGVMSTIISFLSTGGTPQDVLTLLSSSYVGYAQLTELVCRWLVLAGLSREAVAAVVRTELADVLRRHFDARRADSIMVANGPPPTWLEQLVQSRTWRPLLLELADENKHCMLLQYAVRRIAESDDGGDDVLESRSASATYPSVFIRALVHRFRALVESGPMTAAARLDELTSLSCVHEGSFLLTLALLQRVLERSADGGSCQYLMAEVERVARGRAPVAAAHIAHSVRFGLQTSVLDHVVARMKADDFVNEADIRKVAKAVLDGGDTVQIERVLRDFFFADLLIRTVFAPQPACALGLRPIVRQLLAACACVAEHAAMRASSSDGAGAGAAAHAGGATGVAAHDVLARADVLAVERQLNETEQACRNLSLSSELTAAVARLEKLVLVPVCASGTLAYVSALLRQPSFYDASFDMLTCQAAIWLVARCVSSTPSLLPDALTTLREAFALANPLDIGASLTVQRYVVEAVIDLAAVDCAVCLGAAQRFLVSAEKSVVRHFFVLLAQCVRAPVDADVCTGMSRMLCELAPLSVWSAADARTRQAVVPLVDLLEKTLTKRASSAASLRSKIAELSTGLRD